MWNADSSTLTLKNMIIVGTDETGSDTGSFGIQGGKDISIVYEGVNVVCGGTSESGDSCGIMDEVSDEDGLSLSGDGTLIALGRQAGDSSCGIQLSYWSMIPEVLTSAAERSSPLAEMPAEAKNPSAAGWKQKRFKLPAAMLLLLAEPQQARQP
ncbi:MAG: hypothetical protein LKM35_05985 [Lachnospiraceae bacterium]|jgi:hypothetical protein|nr:hypothetical protein [Lachnospiraceae bacterium]